MSHSVQKLLLTVFAGLVVTLSAAAPAAAQPRMMNSICAFGGNFRPTKTDASTVFFQQTVICNQQITNIDLSIELFYMPPGSRTWQFVTGATSNGPPNVVQVNPFFSENRAQLFHAPCRNGTYIARSTATVQLNDWFDGGTLESPATWIGNCPLGAPG